MQQLNREKIQQILSQPDFNLVKALEEDGIGRPSTYAQIISTLQDREYVQKVDNRNFVLHYGDLTDGSALVRLMAEIRPWLVASIRLAARVNSS